MADWITFDPYADGPDPADLDAEQLRQYLAAVRAQIAQLDGEEPADMDSEAYDEWGDRHEELEDLADEILERLEELEG